MHDRLSPEAIRRSCRSSDRLREGATEDVDGRVEWACGRTGARRIVERNSSAGHDSNTGRRRSRGRLAHPLGGAYGWPRLSSESTLYDNLSIIGVFFDNKTNSFLLSLSFLSLTSEWRCTCNRRLQEPVVVACLKGTSRCPYDPRVTEHTDL